MGFLVFIISFHFAQALGVSSGTRPFSTSSFHFSSDTFQKRSSYCSLVILFLICSLKETLTTSESKFVEEGHSLNSIYQAASAKNFSPKRTKSIYPINKTSSSVKSQAFISAPSGMGFLVFIILFHFAQALGVSSGTRPFSTSSFHFSSDTFQKRSSYCSLVILPHI